MERDQTTDAHPPGRPRSEGPRPSARGIVGDATRQEAPGECAPAAHRTAREARALSDVRRSPRAQTRATRQGDPRAPETDKDAGFSPHCSTGACFRQRARAPRCTWRSPPSSRSAGCPECSLTFLEAAVAANVAARQCCSAMRASTRNRADAPGGAVRADPSYYPWLLDGCESNQRSPSRSWNQTQTPLVLGVRVSRRVVGP